MNIENMIEEYMKSGYKQPDAEAKVCQDLILLKISNSKFKNNITIKGGVVMHSISNDVRRATRDLDLDFIKYSLSDDSIKSFIETLNKADEDVNIEIIGNIKKLHQENYEGKRVNLKLLDKFGYELKTKLDIGVHKLVELEQDEYCFNLDVIGKYANLLVNSKEQIFTEKLKSLLKLGPVSTRYKDLFDFYYLINITEMDREKLYKCVEKLIFLDPDMRENNINDIVERLNSTFYSIGYKSSLSDPKVNWLDISIDDAIQNVLKYLQNLETVLV